MKFDSIFDSIRVKPGEQHKPKPQAPTCEWAKCSAPATNRAPKGRNQEGAYWRFCLEHTRAYNQSYNYFSGMSDDAVAEYQKDALTGHRPTWKMGANGGGNRDPRPNFASAADPLGVFRELGGRGAARPERENEREGRMIRNAERKALNTLGVELSATREEIKAQFKILVKRHHPDVNGGDRSSEDRLREVIQAYNYLKTAGFL